MRNALVLAGKEARSFFNSWIGVFTFTFFYLLSGGFFAFLVFTYARLSVESAEQGIQAVQGLGLTRFLVGNYFLNLSALLLFFVPVITMRSFAEERKQQTLELLYTYPFSDFEIVWGKFLGLVWVFELLFLPTLIYLFLIQWLGGALDWGPVISAYLGFWLLGNAYLSIGLFISSLTENQIVAAIASFGMLILFWMFDWAAALSQGNLANFFKALSPLAHYRDFALGIIDLSHVVYFFFFHFYFLFLTMRSIESRHWKA